MKMTSPRPWGHHTRRGLLLAAVAFAAAGCSDLTATVTGKVYLDDEPIEIRDNQRGIVVFRPVAGGATCTGLVDRDGGYRIATGGSSGLAAGDYLVSVRVIELVESSVAGEAPTGLPITPAVYSDPLTSGLSVLVGRGSNQYDIKLDSSVGPAMIVSEPLPEAVLPEGGGEAPAEEDEDSPVENRPTADDASPAGDALPNDETDSGDKEVGDENA